MDLPFSFQGKRQRIGIDKETAMEIIIPTKKRFRLSSEESAANSPDGVVSDLETLGYDTAMDLSVNSTEGESTVEWWKKASARQGQHKSYMLGDDDFVCHVCESVYKKPTVTIYPSSAIKPANSILAYFKCTSKTSAKKKPPLETICKKSATISTTCTFCERDCCGSCLEQCEKCRKQYCRLCLRNDYLGNYSRVLCLDCAEDGCQEHDTSMRL